MAAKKKTSSGKKKVKRVDVAPSKKKKKADKKPAPKPEAKKLPEKVREKDAGFGVIKIIAGLIIALAVGSMFLFNQAGGKENARGDKIPGERCSETIECETGNVCYSYKDAEKRCMTRCSKEKTCELGFTCVSATKQKRRRGFRITDICVTDATL